MCTEAGQFEQAESLLLWIFDAAKLEITTHEGKKKWKEAGETYLLLLGTYYREQGKVTLATLKRLWARFSKGSCVTKGETVLHKMN